MSVRLPEESLEPGIIMILSGIELFSEAIRCRYDADDPWRDNHLSHLNDLDIILTEMKYALYKLKKETW